MWRMAFDIGGTFTDFVLAGIGEPPRFLKIASTPDDPSAAVMLGFDQLLTDAGISASSISTLLHATTVATNAIIERKGRPTALITTAGFRDVLLIGRQKRYETYDLYMDKPAPLVARRHVLEVKERVGPAGEIEEELGQESLNAVIETLSKSKIQSVAVSLIHAYANPAHENLIKNTLQDRLPELLVSLSSDISPKFREYERTSTTVANAYVRPIVADYISRLQSTLGRRGVENEMFIMQSAGGLISTEIAVEEPVRIVESGPAAGVLMSALVGTEAGEDSIITFDMGGTTAKLGAVDDGIPAITPTFEVDPIRYRPGSGLPINVPAIELLEIGAGGGSIARTEFGVIHIGPESAGAEPGPICYGLGGQYSTITDANLVLGYLNPNFFNGGAMTLNVEAAKAGIARDIGEPLGLDVDRAAWGVHAAANANMEKAMRIVSVERGRDPRRYSLVAFGGAGPVHAARLAESIGIPTVVVPFGAGVGSAIGLLRAEPKIDTSITRVVEVIAENHIVIAEIYVMLKEQADRDLHRLGVDGVPKWSRYGYFRYQGQGYEIRVDLPLLPIEDGYPDAVCLAFHDAYARNYGYHDELATIEAVDWHLVATLETSEATLDLGWQAPGESTGDAGKRPVWFPEQGTFVETAIHDRSKLGEGWMIDGPAIVEDPEATIVVPPDMSARVSRQGHIVINTGVDV